MTNDNDAPKPSLSKGTFYRLAREWHGYLSAFAFLALIFFAGTGILLNHPGLLRGDAPAPVDIEFTLDKTQLAGLNASAAQGETLANLAAAKTELAGAVTSTDPVGRDLFVNLTGVRGTSTLTANLDTGAVTIHVEREHVTTVMNELHRGERAGPAWQFFIDVVAAVLIVMSLLGYVIFLSLRFRLTTALVLTGASLIVMVALFLFATS